MRSTQANQPVSDIALSATRLQARLHEINAWVQKLKKVREGEQESPEQKSAAVILVRYFWVLRIHTKCSLLYKLRTTAIKNAGEESSGLLLRFANTSGHEFREIQKQQARLVFYQLDCDVKRSLITSARWNATQKLPGDLDFVDHALDLLGMDRADDLRPRSFFLLEHIDQDVHPVSGQKKGGRPKQADTLEFFNWIENNPELSIQNVCKHFDQIKLPVSTRFTDGINTKDGITWMIAYKRRSKQMAKWFNDKQVAYGKAHPNAARSSEQLRRKT